MSIRRAIAGLVVSATACNRPQVEVDTGGEVAARIEVSGVQSCAAPEARETEGPFEQITEGDFPETSYLVKPDYTGEWGLVVADLDGDGHLDVYLPRFGPGELYLGDGSGGLNLASGRMPEPPEDMGQYAMGAMAVDVDADGDLDLIESTVGVLQVLRNDGSGHFEEIGASLDLDIGDGSDFATTWADFDGDGDLDLLLPMYPSEDPSPEQIEAGEYVDGVPSELLENRDGRFVDRSDLLPADTNDGHPFVAGWQDLDDDRRPDLLTANDHGVDIRSNRAWRNTGEGFVDISAETGMDAALDSMGIGIGDMNGDLIPDMVYTGWGEFALLESDGMGGWYQSQAARGLLPSTQDQQVGWGLEMEDLDNDGRLDVFAVFGHWEMFPEALEGAEQNNPLEQPDGLFLQQPDGSLIDVGPDWGVDDTGSGRGVILADMNEDGWLDLIKRQIHAPPQLWLSRCGNEAWMTLEVTGAAENPTGIGTRVEVLADTGDGETRQVRWIRAGGTSIASGGPPMVHFGLGTADQITELKIVWPDGRISLFENIEARQRIHVVR